VIRLAEASASAATGPGAAEQPVDGPVRHDDSGVTLKATAVLVMPLGLWGSSLAVRVPASKAAIRSPMPLFHSAGVVRIFWKRAPYYRASSARGMLPVRFAVSLKASRAGKSAPWPVRA
jgi:hypothetical protein